MLKILPFFLFLSFHSWAQFLEENYINEEIPKPITNEIAQLEASLQSALINQQEKKIENYISGPYFKEFPIKDVYKFLSKTLQIPLRPFLKVYIKRNFPIKSEYFIPLNENNSFRLAFKHDSEGFTDYFFHFQLFNESAYDGLLGLVWQNKGGGWKLYGVDRGRLGMFGKNRDYWANELKSHREAGQTLAVYLKHQALAEMDMPMNFLRFDDQLIRELNQAKIFLGQQQKSLQFPMRIKEYKNTLVTKVRPIVFAEGSKIGIYADVHYYTEQDLGMQNLSNVIKEAKILNEALEKLLPGLNLFREDVFFTALDPKQKHNPTSFSIPSLNAKDRSPAKKKKK